MFRLTVEQAELFRHPALTWYAQLVDRVDKGKTVFSAEEFDLPLRTMQDRMALIRKAGFAEFRPVAGKPGAYEIIFTAKNRARELLAQCESLGLSWSTLTVELLASLIERYAELPDRLEEILLTARASAVEAAHLPKYLVTSLRTPPRRSRQRPEEDPECDAYYSDEAIQARARKQPGYAEYVRQLNDPTNIFSPAYWSDENVQARARKRAEEEAKAHEQQSTQQP